MQQSVNGEYIYINTFILYFSGWQQTQIKGLIIVQRAMSQRARNRPRAQHVWQILQTAQTFAL